MCKFAPKPHGIFKIPETGLVVTVKPGPVLRPTQMQVTHGWDTSQKESPEQETKEPEAKAVFYRTLSKHWPGNPRQQSLQTA